MRPGFLTPESRIISCSVKLVLVKAPLLLPSRTMAYIVFPALTFPIILSSVGCMCQNSFFLFTDMERVLATYEKKPLVLNRAQLSIRIYHEFLESEEVGVQGDKVQVSQQSEAKTPKLHIAVDPDVMEFVTTTGFRDELSDSLAAKKSEITWEPNNKMAVIVYQGEDNSDSWHSECIDAVQNYLSKFDKRDVQVNEDFWEAVVAQLSSIRACLGGDPPLVKTVDHTFAIRIVSQSTAVEGYEKKLRSKLEEINREETRKTRREHVPEDRLFLLMKIKFVEKVQETNRKLMIKVDTEGEEIYFEGLQRHVSEATEMLQQQMLDMVEKKLPLSDSSLTFLGSEEGLMKVKCELENNNVEAVFVIGKDTRVVGTSAEHADNAASLVKKLLDSESIREEQFICSPPIFRRYLSECRLEDLHSIEDQLIDFEVKIEHGKDEDDLAISGTKEGLTQAREKLDALIEDTASETFDVEQPGLRKFFESGKGDHLVESVEKDQDCVIQVQTNFGQGMDDWRSQAEGENCTSSESINDDGINDDDDDDDEDEGEEEDEEHDHAGSGSNASSLITLHTKSQQKISWRTGYIEKEKVSVQQI